MITKEQATTMDMFHEDGCRLIVGPRGGRTFQVRWWRRNGMTRTWVTMPSRFRVPVKRGMYAYGYITEQNADGFHTSDECPIRRAEAELVAATLLAQTKEESSAVS